MKSRTFPAVVVAVVLLLIPVRGWAFDVGGALAYVPSDSMAVVGADLDRVRTSPLFAQLYQSWLAESGMQSKVAEIRAQTGLDLRRDLHGVVAAFPRTFPQDDDEFVIVVEADVDEARVVAYAKQQGAEIERKSSPLGPYYALDGGDGAMAFRGKLVIIGGKKTFQRALAAKRGRSASTQGRLAARLGTVSQHHLFAVADLPPEVRKESSSMLPGQGEIRAVAATLDVSGGLQLHAKATTDAAQTARQIVGLLQAFIDEAKSDRTMKKQGLDGYLSLVSLHAAGADIEASVVLTTAQVQRLIHLAKSL